MADIGKPLPRPNEDSIVYWKGCKDHKLLMQQCQACRHVRFYPRIVCPACGRTETAWIEASGKAKVYSYTTVYRAPSAAFKDDVPYVLALVDLDEGPRMMTNLVDCDTVPLSVGMSVSVVFDDVSDEISLPKFRPVKGVA